jgi:hypothetical protein
MRFINKSMNASSVNLGVVFVLHGVRNYAGCYGPQGLHDVVLGMRIDDPVTTL